MSDEQLENDDDTPENGDPGGNTLDPRLDDQGDVVPAPEPETEPDHPETTPA